MELNASSARWRTDHWCDTTTYKARARAIIEDVIYKSTGVGLRVPPLFWVETEAYRNPQFYDTRAKFGC